MLQRSWLGNRKVFLSLWAILQVFFLCAVIHGIVFREQRFETCAARHGLNFRAWCPADWAPSNEAGPALRNPSSHREQ